MKLTCQQCGKKLSKKTARQIEGRVLCSSCLFPPMKEGVVKIKLTEQQRQAALARVEAYNAAQEALGRSIRVKFNGEQYRIAWRGRSSWHSARQIDQYVRNLESQIADRLAQADTRRMAETGTGSGRSPSGTVLSEAKDAPTPLDSQDTQ